jgi:hypothetical protein
MTIQFIEKEKQIPFFRGVIFGDAGSGKSFLAKEFAIKSCKATGINKFILVDTENGWDWLKKEMPENIQILEPKDFQYTANENIKGQDLPCGVELFSAIRTQTDKDPVSCIIIDSSSHIGKLLYYNALKDVNNYKKATAQKFNKAFYPQEDLQFQDWSVFNEKSDIVVNLLKGMCCNVLLCGRATSENAMEGKSIVEATERTVLDWKKMTYEFDFSCLLKPEIDLKNTTSFKTFKTIVLKSRFSDDGKILNSNDFLERWFQFFEKMDFEKIKSMLIDAKDIKNFEHAKNLASKFKLQMNLEQMHELKAIITNKMKEFNNEFTQ